MWICALFLLVAIMMHADSYLISTRFADRDMFMRYTGLGVGHISTYPSTAALRQEIIDKYCIQTKAGTDSDDDGTGFEEDDDQMDNEELGIASDEGGISGVEESSDEEGQEDEEGANDEVEHLGYSVL
jgi:hypothetical protein